MCDAVESLLAYYGSVTTAHADPATQEAARFWGGGPLRQLPEFSFTT